MRTYQEIVDDYLNWYANKTGEEEYIPSNYFNVPDTDKEYKKGIAFKRILDLCYRPKDGLYWFTKFILGDLTYAGYPEKIEFNALWLKWMKVAQSSSRLAIKCPRQHGKTTFWTVVVSIYRASLLQNYNILIESATEDQAIGILFSITKMIERNEFLNSKKSDDAKWTATEVSYNGGRIVARGLGSEVRGGTYDYIVCDDILRSDNKLSDRDVENFLDEELEAMLLVRKGQMIIVGTPKSSTDIFSTIESRAGNESMWKFHVYQAIVDEEKQIILCPERFTWKQLMLMKNTMGQKKFDKEMQCKCYSSGSQLFSEELRKLAIEKGHQYISYSKSKKADEASQYYIGVDCARSGSASGDFTVVIVLAFNPISQEKRVVWMWREKGLKITEQVDIIAQIAKDFNFPVVMVEQNNMGQEFIDQLVDNYNITVEAFTTTAKSKEDLIRGLISVFEHEKMILPSGDDYSYEMSKEIDNELSKFVVEVTPAGNEVLKGSGRSHDDIVMALAIANKCTQAGGGLAFAYSGNRVHSSELERFAKTNDIFEIHRW